MPCGMFGKLPVKRDFVAVNTPREFLTVWEAWLQGGVAASKIALTTNWLQAYLSAPLWRFWLGADICGVPVSGAFMPSVDGVGRHFPLTVFEAGEAGDFILLPSDSANAAWYDQVEDFLLGALEPDIEYQGILTGLEMLPLTAKRPISEQATGIVELLRTKISRVGSIEGIGDAFTAVEADRQNDAQRTSSYWWTIGGEGYEPAVLVANGMPDPHILTAFLTGNFETKLL